MNYYQSCAAKGYYGGRARHFQGRSMGRASINIHKTENSFELLVFAPGRIKENFHLDLRGNELTVSYLPPEGFPKIDWISREYSRGAFERKVSLIDAIDTSGIRATYVDGVLQVSLPIIAGKEQEQRDIPIS